MGKHLFQAFLEDERGQAMTSSASFLAGCALVVMGAYYYGGAHVHGFVNTIVNSAPPGTSQALFR